MLFNLTSLISFSIHSLDCSQVSLGKLVDGKNYQGRTVPKTVPGVDSHFCKKNQTSMANLGPFKGKSPSQRLRAEQLPLLPPFSTSLKMIQKYLTILPVINSPIWSNHHLRFVSHTCKIPIKKSNNCHFRNFLKH